MTAQIIIRYVKLVHNAMDTFNLGDESASFSDLKKWLFVRDRMLISDYLSVMTVLMLDYS